MTFLTKKPLYQVAEWVREVSLIAFLWLPDLAPWMRPKMQIPVTVSVTSYPSRIGKAWLALETLMRQTVRPERLLLVLSTEEFPTKKLPSKIRSQVRRGLTVLWVTGNNRSYDKLLPTREAFPDATIVTFDDDKYFPSNLLKRLYGASLENPGCIVGARGWEIHSSDLRPGVHYGENWHRLNASETGHNLLMPGGNGCLYPPGALDPMVDNVVAAREICPTADDIWFWAAILKSGTLSHCLGLPAHRPVAVQSRTAALSQVNATGNDPQFLAAIDHFGVRGKLEALVRTSAKQSSAKDTDAASGFQSAKSI